MFWQQKKQEKWVDVRRDLLLFVNIPNSYTFAD